MTIVDKRQVLSVFLRFYRDHIEPSAKISAGDSAKIRARRSAKKSALGYRLCFGKTGCLKHFLAEKVIECEDAASNADHGSQGADADAYDTAGSHHADTAGNGYAGDVDEVFAEAQITSAPFADNLGQTVGWIGDQLHIDAHGNADASHYDGDDQHDKTCRERWIRQSQTLQEKVKTCIKELQEQAEGHGKRQLQPVGPLS